MSRGEGAMQKLCKSKYFLMIAGVLCGLINGLLGAGGGIIAVYALRLSLDESLTDQRDVFAKALCVTLPISAVSCLSYAVRGELRMNGIGLYVIPAILGGIVGGVLLGKLRAASLRKLFAALVVISGILLIVR